MRTIVMWGVIRAVAHNEAVEHLSEWTAWLGIACCMQGWVTHALMHAVVQDWEGVAHQVLDELDKNKHGELVKMQTDRTKVIAPKAGGASKLGNADKAVHLNF